MKFLNIIFIVPIVTLAIVFYISLNKTIQGDLPWIVTVAVFFGLLNFFFSVYNLYAGRRFHKKNLELNQFKDDYANSMRDNLKKINEIHRRINRKISKSGQAQSESFPEFIEDIQIDFSDYFEDLKQKVSFYKSVTILSVDELDRFEDTVLDIIGDLPATAEIDLRHKVQMLKERISNFYNKATTKIADEEKRIMSAG